MSHHASPLTPRSPAIAGFGSDYGDDRPRCTTCGYIAFDDDPECARCSEAALELQPMRPSDCRRCDQLMTIIDTFDACADVHAAHGMPTPADHRAWDMHDIAHTIRGEGRHRHLWKQAWVFVRTGAEMWDVQGCPELPDVQARMRAILEEYDR